MIIRSMLTSVLALVLFSISLVTAAKAPVEISSGNDEKLLVELYTSQGCSSCPPAEKLVSGLIDSPRLWNEIIPVAFHVDYWDYIGWKDPFAQKGYAERQRDYKRQGNLSQVYTPGFVVGGEEWRGFFKRQAIGSLRDKPVGILNASIEDQSLMASFSPAAMDLSKAGENKTLTLNVAVLGFDITTDIKAGENRGLSTTSQFVVIGFSQQAIKTQQDGTYKLSTTLPQSHFSADKKALAIWVSEPGNNAPIQAAGGWL